jgi:hypothetical protein
MQYFISIDVGSLANSHGVFPTGLSIICPSSTRVNTALALALSRIPVTFDMFP